MERNAFIHFGLNTWTDQEWGYGDVPASTFDPQELDAEQWCRVIRDAGMKGVILTAKHHDGFCLWPSAYTEYSVKNSPWRDGKGDLVREVSDACKTYGLKFGVYLSPWDRNSAIYGSPEYIEYFRNQLTELLTNYGEVFEVWFDGANGGNGYYGGARETRSVDRKTYYDWETTNALVKQLQPNALIFSDAGPDIRWCGNEHGVAGRTNWATLRRDEAWPGWPRYKELNPGHEDGNYWVPAEINVSIRPGWFYHASEDHKVKDLPRLMDYFYESVGRNGTGLLNFPVDQRGLIHEIDAANVRAWQQSIEADLANNLLPGADIKASHVRANHSAYAAINVKDDNPTSSWATDDGVTSASLTIEFTQPTTFNRFLVQEDISLGQRVQEFTLEVQEEDGNWNKLASETTIGYKRILRLPTTQTKAIRFSIVRSKASPLISNIELYHAPKLISSPVVRRNKDGIISIQLADEELEVRYTTDGSPPDERAMLYEGPISLDGKMTLKVLAIDPDTKKQSPLVEHHLDVSKKNWTVPDSEDEKEEMIFDGDPNTGWHQKRSGLPVDLTVDLGESVALAGFRYLPDQSRYARGIIVQYELLSSQDGRIWQKQASGEFSNIHNSPIWQEITFDPKEARYVKLRALRTTNPEEKGVVGYAEFDIVTE